ncbi:hypothetical protein Tco_1144838 [Tanacetum coccineum]
MSKEVGTPRYLSLVVPLKKVGDEAVHKELGDRMEKTATTASSLEAEQDSESDGFAEIIDFRKASTVHYALTVNPIIYTSCIEQFWATTKVKTVNGVRQIQALIDKKKLIITEESIRSDLYLEDAEGTDCLPTATIFEELTRMGAKSTAWNEFSSTMASLIICLATNQKINMSKYIFDAMLGDKSHHKKVYVNPSHTKKFFANMKRAGKDFPGRITPLFDTIMVQASDEVGLKILRKVSTTRRIESFNDSLGAQEDASKPGRRIENIDADAEVTLVNETQERQDEDLMFDSEVLDDDEMFVDVTTIENEEQSTKTGEAVTTAGVEDSAAPTIPITVEETLAQTLMEIKAAKPKAKGIIFHDLEK